MALILIVIQDVPGQGATVSVVTEPIADLSAPDATEAQQLAVQLLNALPANPPAETETQQEQA